MPCWESFGKTDLRIAYFGLKIAQYISIVDFQRKNLENPNPWERIDTTVQCCVETLIIQEMCTHLFAYKKFIIRTGLGIHFQQIKARYNRAYSSLSSVTIDNFCLNSLSTVSSFKPQL